MKALLFILLLIFITPLAFANGCDRFNNTCQPKCKTRMCEDACARGRSYCMAESSSGRGCNAAVKQCEEQCSELDSWEGQRNCYHACWAGKPKCA